eukprot:m.160726 g.160726  ORF g.160726 m.160726 type:complete len:89 (-) comp16365_c0_seq1:89-355(-)
MCVCVSLSSSSLIFFSVLSELVLLCCKIIYFFSSTFRFLICLAEWIYLSLVFFFFPLSLSKERWEQGTLCIFAMLYEAKLSMHLRFLF